MTYLRLAYDDADSTRMMYDDCSAAVLAMPGRAIGFENFSRDLPQPQIEVSEAVARLAGSFQQDD